MVVIQVQRAVLPTAPKPFTMFIVYQVLFDVFPAVQSTLQRLLVTKILIDVQSSYDVLSLNPPMQVIVHITSIQIGFMYHASIRP